MVERVQLGDAHRVRHHRARTGATAGAHANTIALGPVDEVRHDQEVAGEAHGGNDPHLVLGLLAHPIGNTLRESVVQALLDLLHEPGFLVLALGHGEVRHVVRLGVELHVEVIRVELEALGVGQGRARLHAQQRRVSGVVFLPGVVQVVGGHVGQVQLLSQAVQVLLHVAFDVEAVVHDLAVEVVLAEDVAEVAGGL